MQLVGSLELLRGVLGGLLGSPEALGGPQCLKSVPGCLRRVPYLINLKQTGMDKTALPSCPHNSSVDSC